MFLEKDFHDTNEFITLVSHDGYSLRINAFFIWLKRSRYSLWYIARRLGTTPDDIINRLRNRAKFNKAELRKLVYICKGVNGLSTMTDRDVVEKASNAKNGDKFKRLYAGEDLQKNHSNSDMSLMNLLAYWCNGDKEQMLRIFATSGLFRPNKSPDYYEGTAIKALRSMPVKSTYTPTIPKNTGGNGKR